MDESQVRRIMRDSALSDRIRQLAVITTCALIAAVCAWQLSMRVSITSILLCIVFTSPLWAPLRGLIRGQRRTFAWSTLCVIPYFVLGVTEAVARPTARAWPAVCLALALLLFVALIAYLRASRSVALRSVS